MDSAECGYEVMRSCLGLVYVPREGVEVDGEITIRYEKHPWIECFELDGIRASAPKRTAHGTKSFEGFVRSLSTIYSKAYEDYAEYPDPEDYFAHACEYFIKLSDDPDRAKIFRKFCGFVENMWREGNAEMCKIALGTIFCMLKDDTLVFKKFLGAITCEFKEWLKENNYGD